MTTRQNLVTHLINKGYYEPDVDDYNIDMILENMEFAKLLSKDLRENGIIITTRSGNNILVTKVNPAFNAYQMAIRNIHQAAIKLGITRQDRLKLKLLEEKTKDDFDRDFNAN